MEGGGAEDSGIIRGGRVYFWGEGLIKREKHGRGGIGYAVNSSVSGIGPRRGL